MDRKWRGLPRPLEHVPWHSGVTVLSGPLSALPLGLSETGEAVQQALFTQARPPSAAMVNFFHMPGLPLRHTAKEDGERHAARVAAVGGEGVPRERPRAGGTGVLRGGCRRAGEALGEVNGNTF